MKKSLRPTSVVVVLILSVLTAKSQVQVLAENFSGFTTGSHTTPSTADASSSLDSKTAAPGWSGSLVYPAGGEIKLGTSSSAGWIRTPYLDLTAAGGSFTVEFDIARWPGDAATVQVYIDDNALGSPISPSDSFQHILLSGNDGTSSSRISFRAITKRFFIDNIIITAGNITTGISESLNENLPILIFPVPAHNELIMCNIQRYSLIDIQDITGRTVYSGITAGAGELRLDVSRYTAGIYFVTFRSGNTLKCLRFIKE